MPSQLNRARAVVRTRLPQSRRGLYEALADAIAEYESDPLPGKYRRLAALAREYQTRYGRANGDAALTPAEALALAKLLRRVARMSNVRTRNADRYYA